MTPFNKMLTPVSIYHLMLNTPAPENFVLSEIFYKFVSNIIITIIYIRDKYSL